MLTRDLEGHLCQKSTSCCSSETQDAYRLERLHVSREIKARRAWIEVCYEHHSFYQCLDIHQQVSQSVPLFCSDETRCAIEARRRPRADQGNFPEVDGDAPDLVSGPRMHGSHSMIHHNTAEAYIPCELGRGMWRLRTNTSFRALSTRLRSCYIQIRLRALEVGSVGLPARPNCTDR